MELKIKVPLRGCANSVQGMQKEFVCKECACEQNVLRVREQDVLRMCKKCVRNWKILCKQWACNLQERQKPDE